MEHLQSLALAAGLSWASGVRMYAAVFIVGLLGRFGYVHLPEHLQLLEHNGVLIASGIMLFAEFLADKVPGFDSAWDSIHTFIRIPIGAMLAWGALTDAGPEAQFVAAILGGAITGGTHLAKMSARAAINTSPEPFTNWAASFGEDGMLLAGLWLRNTATTICPERPGFTKAKSKMLRRRTRPFAPPAIPLNCPARSRTTSTPMNSRSST